MEARFAIFGRLHLNCIKCSTELQNRDAGNLCLLYFGWPRSWTSFLYITARHGLVRPFLVLQTVYVAISCSKKLGVCTCSEVLWTPSCYAILFWWFCTLKRLTLLSLLRPCVMLKAYETLNFDTHPTLQSSMPTGRPLLYLQFKAIMASACYTTLFRVTVVSLYVLSLYAASCLTF